MSQDYLRKTPRNIAKDEIRKAAPGLSVANAANVQVAQSAANADNLDGLDSIAFARVVADDTRSIDTPNVGSGVCNPQTLTGGPFVAVQPGDAALVFPAVDSVLVPTRGLQSTAGQVQFALCNPTIAAINPGPLDWRVIVLR